MVGVLYPGEGYPGEGAPAGGTTAVAGVASGVGTAGTASTRIAPVEDVASGTGTAWDSTGVQGHEATAGVASAVGTGLDAAASTAATAGVASAVAAALNPSLSTSQAVDAAPATGTGSAGSAALAVNASATTATASGSAWNATTQNAADSPTAGVAAGTGVAWDAVAGPILEVDAGLASAVGTAFNASVSQSSEPFTVHDQLKLRLGLGTSWTGTTWKVALFARGTWSPTASDGFVSDATTQGATEITTSGYVRQTLAGKTVTLDTAGDRALADAANIAFSLSGIATFDTVVVFAPQTDDSDSWLAITYPLPGPISASGAVTLNVDPDGLLELV